MSKQLLDDKNKKITLTKSQQYAFNELKKFIYNNDRVFILKGYAGTGKTTLMKELIDAFIDEKLSFSLLASTGRASKILSNITGQKAITIHSEIYKFKDFNEDLDQVVKSRKKSKVEFAGDLFLTFEMTPIAQTGKKRFYIVDESSMISDVSEKNITQASFGSGRLLKDMLDYDNSGKFIFVGDNCQLPPVVQAESPALSPFYLKEKHSIQAKDVELTEIMRQGEGNDIIMASQKVRQLYSNVPQVKWGMLPLKGYKNIRLHSDSVSMINRYVELIKDRGFNETTLICYSNAKCNQLTNLIRPALGMRGELKVGDLLLVTQNNIVSGLMNGDMVTLEQVEDVVHKRAGLTFRKVEVKELFTGNKYSQLLLEELVYSNNVNLDSEQQKALFIDFFLRMKEKGLNQKHREFKEKLRTDSFLNSLRCSYGYALTCHKSQGGEWDYVFLDIPRNFTLNPCQSTFQWIYTAMTRAKVELNIVNDFFIK